jgi:Dullard-like phosphatase family protein
MSRSTITWLVAVLVICAVIMAYLSMKAKEAAAASSSPSGAAAAAADAPSSAPHKKTRHRWVLVLDLDETLVHTPNEEGRAAPIERPYVREFLRRVAETFDEVIVFTAGTKEYASPVLDGLDPDQRIFGRRLYRESCSIVELAGVLSVVKDLRRLGEADLSRVRLVDNTPSTYALQPASGVPISSFYGDPSDRALVETLARLVSEVAMDGRSS